VAEGTALQYQWQRSTNWGDTWQNVTIAAGNYTNPNAAQMNINSTPATFDGNLYRCVVTNAHGNATSIPARLSVVVGPQITQQPIDTRIVPRGPVTTGGSAVFEVKAYEHTLVPNQYQWQQTSDNGSTWANLTHGMWGGRVKITHVSLGWSRLTLDDCDYPMENYRYRCVVSNTAGAFTSNQATLLFSAMAPQLFTQPQDVTITAGSGAQATFTATVVATPTAVLQWQRRYVEEVKNSGFPAYITSYIYSDWHDISNGGDISGATTNTLTINVGYSGNLYDRNRYRLRARNGIGEVHSNYAELRVR